MPVNRCDKCGVKIPKTAATPASKREVSRAMKESAELWEELTDVEIKLNVIVAHLLGGIKHKEFAELVFAMTEEQAEKLQAVRERLLSYDKGPVFPATDEGA